LTVRHIRSEVEVGAEKGLPQVSVISCDNLLTVSQAILDVEPVGSTRSSGPTWIGRCATPSTSDTDRIGCSARGDRHSRAG